MTSREVVDANVVTINRYLMEQQKKFPEAVGEFTQLLSAILTCVKAVSDIVLTGIAKRMGDKTVLDNMANTMFINLLRTSFTTCLMVSENSPNVIEVALKDQGKYIVCFDPLDGTDNIDFLGPVGSLFCIYKRLPEALASSCVVGTPRPKKWPTIKDALQSGRNILASGYALYSSATLFVLATGTEVCEFMLDPSIGDFVLTQPKLRIRQKGNFLSIDEGHANMWGPAVTQYVRDKKFPKSGKPSQMRFIGSLVGDFHRTLKYGGIYMYPEPIPKKLKLLYECNPLAHVIEVAGGKASDGRIPILDIQPQDLHQTTGIYMGSVDDMDEFLSVLSSVGK